MAQDALRLAVLIDADNASAAVIKELLEEVAKRRSSPRASGGVRVLTHCNTGSLATAAYGTALGVIRSLHEQGRLEHAYCCETRPYNQVRRGGLLATAGARKAATWSLARQVGGCLDCRDAAVW